MSIVRVTKEFKFEMGHALLGYDGVCKYVHGHSYILFVTVKGKPIAADDNAKLGMVLDFGDLSAIVDKYIVNFYDHSFAINKDVPEDVFSTNHEMFQNVHRLDFQPTCENLVLHFAELLQAHLPASVNLHSIKLHETAKAFAEWYAEDNR